MREKRAVAIDGGPQRDMRRMPHRAALEFVDVRLDRAHRTAGRAREEVARELIHRETLAAEVTADERRFDDDLIARRAADRGHEVAHLERRFVRAYNVDRAVVV